jgi:hypothetical protein
VYNLDPANAASPYKLQSFGKDGRQGGDGEGEDIVFQ